MAPFKLIASGAAAAFLLMGAAGLAVVEFGLFDTRASTPHDPLTAWATHATMIRAVQNAAKSIPAPERFTLQQVGAGARDYARDCASCHGGPGVSRAAWVQGMNPPPPYLLDAARWWTPSQLFYLIRNGVKMTGMPAWSPVRSEAEAWDVVAFITAMPKLSSLDYARLTPPPAAPPGS